MRFSIEMSLPIFSMCLLFQLIDGQQRTYNYFMPDLPSSSHSPLSSSSSSSTSTALKVHSFAGNSFRKLHLSGGPFNIKLYRHPDANDNYTSVDVEAEESVHKLVLIDIIPTDTLYIRMTEKVNTTNITMVITYSELTELHIDGMINIQCLNQIRADQFRLDNRATGLIKLKFNVNQLDAYLHSIGHVKLCGEVHQQTNLQSLGVGDVQCRHLLTRKINVVSSGIGNIFITATDEINVTLSGIGTVYYTGPINQQIKTGLGDIVAL